MELKEDVRVMFGVGRLRARAHVGGHGNPGKPNINSLVEFNNLQPAHYIREKMATCDE